MPNGLIIAVVLIAIAVAIAVVGRRQRWLGSYEDREDRLSGNGRTDAARYRSNSGMPF